MTQKTNPGTKTPQAWHEVPGLVFLYFIMTFVASCRTYNPNSQGRNGVASLKSHLAIELSERQSLSISLTAPITSKVSAVTVVCDDGQQVYPLKIESKNYFEMGRGLNGCNIQLDEFSLIGADSKGIDYIRGDLVQDSEGHMWFNFAPKESGSNSGTRLVEVQNLASLQLCGPGSCAIQEYRAKFIVISIEGTRVALKGLRIIDRPSQMPSHSPSHSPSQFPGKTPAQSAVESNKN